MSKETCVYRRRSHLVYFDIFDWDDRFYKVYRWWYRTSIRYMQAVRFDWYKSARIAHVHEYGYDETDLDEARVRIFKEP